MMEKKQVRLIDIRNTEQKEFGEFLEKRKQDGADVSGIVKEILEQVRTRGDQAVLEYTACFDQYAFPEASAMKVTEEEIRQAYEKTGSDLIRVIRTAAENIKDFHQKQMAETFFYEKEPGVQLGTMRKPLHTVGIYVPAGTAPLISSVLMNAIPAKVAGVKNLIMLSPPGKEGCINPAVLAAADIAGVTEIYKVGGAQAVAALAYGTQTIPRADKITGPGNIFVATAKKLVYGDCNIDMIAGPSEILILADHTAEPEFLAADMLSQAEHDPMASSILITTEEELVSQVNKELESQIALLPRKSIAERALRDYSAIVLVKDLQQGLEAANLAAPEHLELCVAQPQQYLEQIETAGAVFLGNYTPEPLGDYYAGPNHVLPTTGTARFFSPLNVWDFIKQINVIAYSQEALLSCAQDVMLFAEAEELTAHSRSIEVRKKRGGV